MTDVRVVVRSPLGDIEVEVEGYDYFGAEETEWRGTVDKLLNDAAHKIRLAYEIKEA